MMLQLLFLLTLPLWPMWLPLFMQLLLLLVDCHILETFLFAVRVMVIAAAPC